MKAVIQRVTGASVNVGDRAVGSIGPGILILFGAAVTDTEDQVRWLADKVLGLRIFADASGKMNLDVCQIKGDILVVSQFTLYGDCRKGKRPSYSSAAPAEAAEKLYVEFISRLERSGLRIETGQFGAMMKVELINDGPVTLIVETPPSNQNF